MRDSILLHQTLKQTFKLIEGNGYLRIHFLIFHFYLLFKARVFSYPTLGIFQENRSPPPSIIISCNNLEDRSTNTRTQIWTIIPKNVKQYVIPVENLPLKIYAFFLEKVYDLPHFPSKSCIKISCNRFRINFEESKIVSFLISPPRPLSYFARHFVSAPVGADNGEGEGRQLSIKAFWLKLHSLAF